MHIRPWEIHRRVTTTNQHYIQGGVSGRSGSSAQGPRAKLAPRSSGPRASHRAGLPSDDCTALASPSLNDTRVAQSHFTSARSPGADAQPSLRDKAAIRLVSRSTQVPHQGAGKLLRTQRVWSPGTPRQVLAHPWMGSSRHGRGSTGATPGTAPSPSQEGSSFLHFS